MKEAHLQNSEAVAAFCRQWRPLVAAFSESLRHVQQCQLIQFGTCPRADCEVTVDRIEHFAYCRTLGRLRSGAQAKDCEACQFVLSVLVQHALDCSPGGHDACFVPDCPALKVATRTAAGDDPVRVVRTLLGGLTGAEVRTVVWCLGGGDPRQLFLSTGQDHLRWSAHGENL